MENLQEANQDKARHLEQLKEENHQLNTTLLRQVVFPFLCLLLQDNYVLGDL